MSRREEPPVTLRGKLQSSDLGDSVTTHPAFAAVSITKPSGQYRFFGSDVQHSGGVSLKIARAEMHRNLANDYVYETDQLIEVVMSEAQWARLIASAGMGLSVPVTLSRVRDGEKLVGIPEIAPPTATRAELFGEELRRATAARIASVSAALEELRSHIEGGKLSKVELRRLVSGAAHNVSSLPGTAKFVMDQFVEHVEDVATATKTDVDAYVTARMGAAGLPVSESPIAIENLQDITAP